MKLDGLAVSLIYEDGNLAEAQPGRWAGWGGYYLEFKTISAIPLQATALTRNI